MWVQQPFLFDFVESDFSEKNVSIRHVTELYMGPSTVLERRVLAEVVYRKRISYISATEDFGHLQSEQCERTILQDTQK